MQLEWKEEKREAREGMSGWMCSQLQLQGGMFEPNSSLRGELLDGSNWLPSSREPSEESRAEQLPSDLTACSLVRLFRRFPPFFFLAFFRCLCLLFLPPVSLPTSRIQHFCLTPFPSFPPLPPQLVTRQPNNPLQPLRLPGLLYLLSQLSRLHHSCGLIDLARLRHPRLRLQDAHACQSQEASRGGGSALVLRGWAHLLPLRNDASRRTRVSLQGEFCVLL